jgi:NitT/TauT family transport system permease protein
MIALRRFPPVALAAGLLAVLSIGLPVGGTLGPVAAVPVLIVAALLIAAATGVSASFPFASSTLIILAAPHAAAVALLATLPDVAGDAGPGFWCLTVAAWVMAMHASGRLASPAADSLMPRRAADLAVAALFGAWILILWQLLTIGLGVPGVILPAPSAIGAAFAGNLGMLAADFQQTFIRAVLPGWAMGCGLGFAVALLVDRSPFLRHGLLPVGNFVSALPVVGIAPIMVMWFGFDWQSKAAVVVVMTFFPMLVNTVAGLAAAGHMERDLMRSWAATPGQAVRKLRLPAAMPFIFNALKINSTLALIGAIVAEFFGTPIVGMGFRIKIAIGRLQLDVVWAEIAVAALAGSLFYGALVLLERAVTFWHPSVRGS